MILLLSTDSDYSTDLIEDWLVLFNADYCRINCSLFCHGILFCDPFDTVIKLDNNITINTIDVNVVFNHKWQVNDYFKLNGINSIHLEIKNSIKREIEEFDFFLKNKFNDCRVN